MSKKREKKNLHEICRWYGVLIIRRRSNSSIEILSAEGSVQDKKNNSVTLEGHQAFLV
jgi:hypothetical protein